MRTLFFDMDGTLNDFYAQEGWLDKLRAHDPSPYLDAPVLHNMSILARYLNKAQRMGYKIGIISWLSKDKDPEYEQIARKAKLKWLSIHLPSVHWDEIHIVSYGTPKHTFRHSTEDCLFDDERTNWGNWTFSFPPDIMLPILKGLITHAP